MEVDLLRVQHGRVGDRFRLWPGAAQGRYSRGSKQDDC
jgi:hypothetical protein